jgi:hypothetical protein
MALQRATATNMPLPQATFIHVRLLGSVRAVQVTPSVEVYANALENLTVQNTVPFQAGPE